MTKSALTKPRGLRQLPVWMIAPWVVATIPVLTALIVWIGPAAHRPEPATGLSAEASAASLQEPTDRAALVAWIFAAMLIACVFVLPRLTAWITWAPGRRLRGMAIWGTLPGAVLLGAGFIYSRNIANLMPAVRVVDIVLGLAIGGMLVALGVYGSRWRTAVNAALVASALALFVPLIIQLPDRLGDPFHAPTTFGELLAVSAGAVPMHDFFPQYTFLLGYPIALVVKAFPADAVAITTWWLIGLQFVAIAVAIWGVIWSGGRRVVGAAFVLVPALLFTAGQADVTASTYFGVNPLRTVLPVLAIGTACWAFSQPHGGRGGMRYAIAGVLAGLAALNNPDYGLPVVVIVVVTALITATDGSRVRAFAAVLLGALSPTAIFALLAWAAAAPIHLADYLLLPRVFGSAGYVNVPMPAIGLHIGAVVLFTVALTVGLSLLRSTRGRPRSRRARSGLILTLVGGWSLLTLPYYAGRSLAPTLLGGYALQIGWTLACLYPLIVIGMRASRMRHGRLSSSAAFSLIAGLVGLGVAGWGLVNVSHTDGWSRAGGVDLNPPGAVLTSALTSAPAPLADAIRAGSTAQIVGVPALTALATGIPSASAFAQPELATVAPFLAYRQCQVLALTSAAYVIVPTAIEPSLASVPLCRSHLRFDAAIHLGDVAPGGGLPPFAALPRRTG